MVPGCGAADRETLARSLAVDIISRLSTHRQECTVVLTTHNMEEAEALASSVGIMVGAAADPNLCTNLDLVCAKCCV